MAAPGLCFLKKTLDPFVRFNERMTFCPSIPQGHSCLVDCVLRFKRGNSCRVDCGTPLKCSRDAPSQRAGLSFQWAHSLLTFNAYGHRFDRPIVIHEAAKGLAGLSI